VLANALEVRSATSLTVSGALALSRTQRNIRVRTGHSLMLSGSGWTDAYAMNATKNQRTTMASIRDAFRERGLVRVREGRVLGGVLAGLGRRLGLRPWPTRLLFLGLLLLIPGSQLLVYPVLWIMMPEESASPGPSSDRGQW
jgi:phage shock protein C